MDLLKNPEKLDEILELFIEKLQQQGMILGTINDKERDLLKEQIIEKLLNNGTLVFNDQGLKFQPNDPLEEQKRPLDMVNLLFLMITIECIKQYDFKPLFGEKREDAKEQEMIDKLIDALRRLKEAKNINEAQAIFDEVMTLCDELSNKPHLKIAFKMQIEMARMMAQEMLNVCHMKHDEDYLPKPKPGASKHEEDEEENIFITYLRNLYGGVNPHTGGITAAVVVTVCNSFSYGASNPGDANDRSQIAEANRFDLQSDSSGRENILFQRLIGMGGNILNALHNSRLLTPTPTNTPD